jgi:hypothetical protein
MIERKYKCDYHKSSNIFTELEMAGVTYDERKQIFETIKVLSKPEQEAIFRIIRKAKENYTENSNGIFFDLSDISDDTLLQIKDYLHFCLKTRQEHEDRLKELESIRIQNEHYTEE